MRLSPHTRATLADYVTVLVVACLLVALAGGYVAATTHLQDRQTTEQRPAGSWTVETAFDHGATVQEDTPVFDEGDRLEGRSLYFARLTPALDGAYVVEQRGTGTEPATVTAELRLVRRAVETTGEGGTVYWRESERLAGVENATLPADRPLRLPFAVNVTEQQRRIVAIEQAIGASPGTTEILLVAEVTVAGGTADASFTDRRVERLELQPGGDLYRVETAVEGPRTHEATETVTVAAPPDPLRAYVSLALLVVGLLGAGALGVARRTGALELDPAERRRVRFERQRREFDDWISAGRAPTTDGPTVRLDSLEDVVDVAIDSNRRVIESDGRYHVFVDDVIYIFVPEWVADGAELGGSPSRTAEPRVTADRQPPTDPAAARDEAETDRGGESDDEVSPFDMSKVEDGER